MLCCYGVVECWLLKGFPNPGFLSIALLLMAYQAGPGERPKVTRCTRVGACEINVMARRGPSELNLSRGLRAAPRPTPRVPKLRLRQQTAACVRLLHGLDHRTRHLLFPGMSSVWGA